MNPDIHEEIDNRFTHHPPKPGQPEVYVALRDKAREFAHMIANHTPVCREQSLALTHLDAVIMFANAAIARHA